MIVTIVESLLSLIQIITGVFFDLCNTLYCGDSNTNSTARREVRDDAVGSLLASCTSLQCLSTRVGVHGAYSIATQHAEEREGVTCTIILSSHDINWDQHRTAWQQQTQLISTSFAAPEQKREHAVASPTTMFDFGECNADIDNLSDLPMLDADTVLQAISKRFCQGEVHRWI